MNSSRIGTKTQANSGCDSEPDHTRDDLGRAAATASDLGEGSDKKLTAGSIKEKDANDPKEPVEIERTPTLDPVCGMAVNESVALHTDRDGKTFYFCSEQCMKSFTETIAGVKVDSKAGSCCG